MRRGRRSLLGAVLLWDFCERVMQGVGTAFLEDVWSRNLLNLFSSPLSISEYVTGLVLTSIMTSSLGLIMMLIVALGVFHLGLFSQGLPLAAFVLVLFVFGITLGIVATAMVLRFGPASDGPNVERGVAEHLVLGQREIVERRQEGKHRLDRRLAEMRIRRVRSLARRAYGDAQ